MSLDITLLIEKCPTCGKKSKEHVTDLWGKNITHNLVPMAKAAKIYTEIWKPEELDITKAQDMISFLALAIKELESNPKKYKKLNPKNGYGSYESFLHFLGEYLMACEKYPDSLIYAWG